MKPTNTLIAAAILLAPTATFAQDMTGAYGGVSAGFADIDVDSPADLEGDGDAFGVYLGYNYDAGDIIYGAEIEYDSSNYEIADGAITVDHATRLKARAGLPVGPGVLSGIGGYILATSDQIPDGQGFLYGVAYDMPIGDGYHVGAELLGHEFEDEEAGFDVGVTTLKVRIGFNF